MFTSSSGCHPFQYMTNQMQTAPTSSFLDTQQKHSSIQEEPYYCSLPPLNFTAPFLDDGGLFFSELLTNQSQHLQQEPHIVGRNDIGLAAETDNQEMNNQPAASKKATTRINNKKKTSKNTNGSSRKPVPRKRSGRKERHSKIHTAQGPRDRRMRLSLQIARKFFDLQDMLGFDKASKTIDWLFTKSKAAIKELTDSLPKVKRSSTIDDGSRIISTTLESDVMSGLNRTTDNNGARIGIGMEGENDSFSSLIDQRKCGKSNEKRASNLLARESRDQARARARERTKEKLKIFDKLQDCSSQSNPNNLEKPVPPNLLQKGEKRALKSDPVGDSKEKNQATADKPSSYFQLPHQMDSISIVDKIFGLTSASKSSSIFDLSQSMVIPSGPEFENQEFSRFPENWDIISNARALSMKLSATGNSHEQNPNAAFATPSSNAQEQNFTSLFMASLDTQDENTYSVFTNFSNSNDQNLNQVPMIIPDDGFHSHLIEDQFPRNSNAVNTRYGSLY